MPTSGPLLETLVGASGGLGAGLALGWWYFRRGATDATTAVDGASAGAADDAPVRHPARPDGSAADRRA